MTTFLRPVMVLAVGAGGMLFLPGCGVEMAAPTSYTSCDAPDGLFRCDAPAGWDINGKGKQYPGMTFSLGNAEIRIETHPVDVTLSAAGPSIAVRGDAASVGTPAPDSGQAPDAESPGVARVHDAARTAFTRYMPDYEELATTDVKTALGEARLSEFTYSERITGKVHGYRASLLVGDRWVQVACTCPESDWVTLRPAFRHVVGSLRPPEAER